MKILINTAHQRFGGAVQVALSFINECKKFENYDFEIWVGYGLRGHINQNDFPRNFTFKFFNFGAISLRKTFFINKSLKQAERECKPDVIISTAGPTYFKSKAPQIIGFNLPLYIYPESPFIRDKGLSYSLLHWLKKQMHFYFFIRDADFYVVQTDDVNQRVRKALKTDKVLTVTNTASSFYKNVRVYTPKLPPREQSVFRFVTITSYYRHKNLEIIPLISEELKRRNVSNVEFFLTLKDADFQNLSGGQQGVLNVGPISPAECPSLYNECDAMFLPTLAECFSASYPEAMLMEKPIVTTDLDFAKSICGDAALFYEAKNVQEAANQIERLIEDEELQKDLVDKGKEQLKTFDSPQERAKKYVELCEKLGGISKKTI